MNFSKHLSSIRQHLSYIVWRIRGNVIATVLCCIVYYIQSQLIFFSMSNITHSKYTFGPVSKLSLKVKYKGIEICIGLASHRKKFTSEALSLRH